MNATALQHEPAVHAEEYTIAIGLIDPDPAQPRLEVDDELADSIKEHGVLKAIEVRPHPEYADRWMIVDGERRWRGARKAGRAEIPAKVTFDVEGISLAARMKRQIVHNQGKPLTPVEEAIAFKKIIDDERAGGNTKYGPTHLAKDIGMSKSTVTDRLAAMEIPAFWLPFIVKGPLQPSHVPILHKWRKLPEKYQRRGLERMQQSDHRWKGGGWDGRRGRQGAADRIHVGDFEHMLDEYFKSFTKPLSEVAGYKGPTERMRNPRGSFYNNGHVALAMDPSQWQPIARRKALERRKKNANGGGSSQQSKWQREEAERQERYRREREREDRERARYAKARPKLLEEFMVAIADASHKDLRDFILSNATPHRAPRRLRAIAAKANTAEAFMRALAVLFLGATLEDTWQARREVPKLGKRFKVDVSKIVKDEEPEAEKEKEKQPDPATTDPGEAGDGRMAVEVDEDEEIDGDG